MRSLDLEPIALVFRLIRRSVRSSSFEVLPVHTALGVLVQHQNCDLAPRWLAWSQNYELAQRVRNRIQAPTQFVPARPIGLALAQLRCLWA